jgi:S1-C subfamily serine protease
VNRSGDLRRILRRLSPGDQASLTIVRPTGRVTLNVTLAQAPAG